MSHKTTCPKSELGRFPAGSRSHATYKLKAFHQTLTEIRTIGQVRCAAFDAFLEATDHNEGQMRVQLEGLFAVEIDGCRLVSSDLEGPIGVAKSMIDAGAPFHMTGTGRLHIALE